MGCLCSLYSLIKVLFVFLLIENTLDLGREPPGLGSRVLDRPWVLFSRGLYSGPSFSLFWSPACSGGLQGWRGHPWEVSCRGMTPHRLYWGVTLVLSWWTPSLPHRDVIHAHKPVKEQPHRAMKHTCKLKTHILYYCWLGTRLPNAHRDM